MRLPRQTLPNLGIMMRETEPDLREGHSNNRTLDLNKHSNKSPNRCDYSLSTSSGSCRPHSLPLVEQALRSTPLPQPSGLYHLIRLQQSVEAVRLSRSCALVTCKDSELEYLQHQNPMVAPPRGPLLAVRCHSLSSGPRSCMANFGGV